MQALYRFSGLCLRTSWMVVQTNAINAAFPERRYFISQECMSNWANHLLEIFDVRVQVLGRPPVEPGLIISNHRSHIDIPIICAHVPCVFVSRGDLRRWPVFGWGGTAVNTIYVDRGDPESRRRAREETIRRLKMGLTVANFPEGGTHNLAGVAPFKPGLFQGVAGEPIRIHPVTIRYADRGADWAGGKKSFLGHVIDQASGPGITAILTFHPALSAADFTCAEELCREVYQRIAAPFAAAAAGPPDPC